MEGKTMTESASTTPPLPREKFPATADWAYLNNAGMGAVPLPVVEAMSQRAMEVARSGELAWPDHRTHVEEVRDRGARLMGVPGEDVAFIKNTTAGLGLVANGLDLGPGDRVVVSDLDFPSSLYPWLALRERGVRVDLVSPIGTAQTLPVRAFADVIAAGPPPALVATSWVQFRRGWRVDLPALARIAHDSGALFCADVIQGLGVIPARLDEWGVDFAMADGHKWLLGAPGTGLLYVRGEHRVRLRPLEPGWNSMAHREQWDELGFHYDDTARRYEGGMPNISGISGLGAALDLLLDAGVEAIWAHVDALCEHVCDGLTRLGATVVTERLPGHRSGIVSVTFPGYDTDILGDRLRARGFVVGARSGALRLSPHGYNTIEELDQLLDSLELLLSTTTKTAEVSR
jgi:selenocysteine lyase/cysteine desulfurase